MHAHVRRQPLDPIEFQGHRSKVKVTWVLGVFFCVCVCACDSAATRGQHLALSKAWRSCLLLLL